MFLADDIQVYKELLYSTYPYTLIIFITHAFTLRARFLIDGYWVV